MRYIRAPESETKEYVNNVDNADSIIIWVFIIGNILNMHLVGMRNSCNDYKSNNTDNVNNDIKK